MQPKKAQRSWQHLIGIFALAVVVCLYVWASSQPRDHVFGGETMGTTYTVKIARATLTKRELKTLQDEIKDLLGSVNSHMSMYDTDSDISRFNKTRETEFVAVSDDTAAVTGFALEIARLTGGAFDPTVMPLVSLWGFGPDGSPSTVPSLADVKSCLENVGYANVAVGEPASLSKSLPGVTLDLNAIAKGYAVDRIAARLVANGYPNVFVEVGGEVAAMGAPTQHERWRIAIDSPKKDSLPGEQVMQIVNLRDECIATSGDYRSFFEDQGRTYSHLLDPRTGYPVSNGVASATVIAHDCMTADALATALMVLGPCAGIDVIENYHGAKALLILHSPGGRFTQVVSAGFRRHIEASRESALVK